jgi:hypothetical protein
MFFHYLHCFTATLTINERKEILKPHFPLIRLACNLQNDLCLIPYLRIVVRGYYAYFHLSYSESCSAAPSMFQSHDTKR